MDIKELSDDNSVFKNIEEIDFEKAKKYDEFFDITLKSKIKLIIKRYIINFLNYFFNKKLSYNNSRKIENVKNKYDEIAGSYIYEYEKDSKFVGFNHFENKIYYINSRAIDHPANLISKFCNYYSLNSIIEVGAGELTTLLPIIQKTKKINFVSALDLSLTRLQKGKEFFKKANLKIDHLIACDAEKLPYNDNSFDLVFSHYCIEQVPVIAKEIIDEMIRISSKYIIFIEPTYEFSNKSSRNKILVKGYPIFKKKHFLNKNTKIMYRNGLPYARYSNYAELTILEKIVKSDGKPKIKCPLSRKLINSDYISDENIKVVDGIIDFVNH